jgi:hypothetical protein
VSLSLTAGGRPIDKSLVRFVRVIYVEIIRNKKVWFWHRSPALAAPTTVVAFFERGNQYADIDH